ncbi:acetyltransferase [Salegentibacter sp. JZCK2]|uniref:acetyltransferase n=1 Tax=Salegentibacter tibetensis TaxID=2873600 RepID=UPI001CCDABFD|nr:acetyltransferase [Salegentibacter tibetensis]MBZ9729061.1 acetyltransferase [Salegentibacter tibetensis]
MKKNLIIYGVGKFAEYVGYVFENDSQYKVIGYCIEEEFWKENTFFNKPLTIFDSLDSEFSPEDHSLFIAVGSNKIRERIYNRAAKMGYEFASYISSKSSHWENLETGKNVFIDEGCTLQPFIKIGNNTIIFASNIGHHSIIGNHSLLSVVTTGGNVSIGDDCNIGLNCSIKQNISISNNTIIGMGCVIEKDILEPSVYTHKGTIKRDLDPEKISRLFLK